MPISSFGSGLQKVISFLPGTYGTSLVRNHSMNGALKALESEGIPKEAVHELRDVLDCNLYFFGEQVSQPLMYVILCVSVIALVGAYVLLNVRRKKQS